MQSNCRNIDVDVRMTLTSLGDVRVEGQVVVSRDLEDHLAIVSIDVDVTYNTGDEQADELLGTLNDRLNWYDYSAIVGFFHCKLSSIAGDKVPTRAELAEMAAEDRYDKMKDEAMDA